MKIWMSHWLNCIVLLVIERWVYVTSGRQKQNVEDLTTGEGLEALVEFTYHFVLMKIMQRNRMIKNGSTYQQRQGDVEFDRRNPLSCFGLQQV